MRVVFARSLALLLRRSACRRRSSSTRVKEWERAGSVWRTWTRRFEDGAGDYRAVPYEGRHRRMRAESSRIIEARFRKRLLCSPTDRHRCSGASREKSLMSRRKHSFSFVSAVRAPRRASEPIGLTSARSDCGAASFLHSFAYCGKVQNEDHHTQNDMPIFPASATLAWKAGALLSTFLVTASSVIAPISREIEPLLSRTFADC